MSRPDLVLHLLDLLEPLGPVTARTMMGGHMLFRDGLSIGLVFEERLYLKVDETTKETFAEAGGEVFAYEREGKTVELSYWTPPDAALEDPEEMRPWATLALEAAIRSRKRAPARKARAASRARKPSRKR